MMSELIEPIARRRMTFNGRSYLKGAKVPMGEGHYRQHGPEGLGWVELPVAQSDSASEPTADAAADAPFTRRKSKPAQDAD